jgi:hypothetical protein
MIASIIASLSGTDIYEIRRTLYTAGDTVLDTPVYTTIKVKIQGLFSYITNQNHKLIGIAQDADAVFSSVTQLSLDSMIEAEGVQYEIITNASAKGFWYPELFTYSLRRVSNLP